MKHKLFLFTLLIFLCINFVSAAFEYDNPDLPKVTGNIDVIGVTDGDGGSIDPGDIDHDDLNKLPWSVAGHTFDTDLNISPYNFETSGDADIGNDLIVAGKSRVNVDGSTSDGYVSVGAGDDLKIYHDGTDNMINSSNNNVYVDMGYDTSLATGTTVYIYKGEDTFTTPQAADPLGVSTIIDTGATTRAAYFQGEAKHSSGNLLNVFGLNSIAKYSGSLTGGPPFIGSVGGGLYGATINSAGDKKINNAYGITGTLSFTPTVPTLVVDAANVQTGLTFVSDPQINVTNLYGLNVRALQGTSQVDNAYGVFINTITLGDNAAGLWVGSAITNAIVIDGDNEKIFWGEGQDASCYYDGTNFVCNPKEVGSGQFQILGDLNQTSGNATFNGIYTEAYAQNEAYANISVQSVYFNVTNMTIGENNGFVFDGSNFTALHSGVYQISSSWSFSGGATREYHLSVILNAVQQDKCHASRVIGTGGDVGSAGFTCMLRLASGDILNIAIENEDSNVDVTIQDINVNFVRVGN